MKLLSSLMVSMLCMGTAIAQPPQLSTLLKWASSQTVSAQQTSICYLAKDSYVESDKKRSIKDIYNRSLEELSALNTSFEEVAVAEQFAAAAQQLKNSSSNLVLFLNQHPKEENLHQILEKNKKILADYEALLQLVSMELTAEQTTASNLQAQALELFRLLSNQINAAQQASLCFFAGDQGIDKAFFFKDFGQAIATFEQAHLKVAEDYDKGSQVHNYQNAQRYHWRQVEPVLTVNEKHSREEVTEALHHLLLMVASYEEHQNDFLIQLDAGLSAKK